MKRRPLVTVAAVLALAVPSAASAKEITSVEVCGAADCETTRSDAILRGLEEGTPTTSGPKRAAPFYRLTITVEAEGESDRWSIDYVAGTRHLLGTDGTWTKTSAATARAIERAARDLEPFPASELTHVAPAAQVDEVVEAPAPAPAAPAVDDGGGVSWIVPTAVVAVVLAGLALLGRRRRRPPLGGPSPAS